MFFPAFSQQQATRADGAGVGAVVPLLAATFVGCPGTKAVASRAAQADCPDHTAPTVSALRLDRRSLLAACVRARSPGGHVPALHAALQDRPPLKATATRADVVRLRVPRTTRNARYRAIVEATDAAGNRSRRTVRLRG